MKTAKRILAIGLSLVLALSVFAISASAIDGAMAFQLETTATSYAAGDMVTVNVYVSSDYNATTMRIPVLFSADVFEISNNNIRLTAYGDCNTFKGSLDANVNNDGSFLPDAYSAEEYSAVLLQWTANVTSSRIGCFSSASLVKCFSFQLKVKSNASGLTGTIFIPSAEETNLFYNQAVTDVTDATTICRINASFTVDSLSVEIGAGEVDGITTYEGSQVIIDHGNKIIKNWEEGMVLETIKTNVKPTGNAVLYYARSVGDAGEYGTGAKVRVFSNSEITAEYYILMYGDINGDGLINTFDAVDISNVAAYYAEFEEEIIVTAADVNASGEIDVFDFTEVAGAAAYYLTIDQTI